MSRTLFENSKAALAFAGMTIFGAVMMVGTSEKSGVLPTVADRIAEQRATIVADASAFAEERSVGDKMSSPAAQPSVFGSYAPPAPGSSQPTTSPASPTPGNSLMTAPLAPGAIVADDADNGADAEGIKRTAVITERELTIEPK